MTSKRKNKKLILSIFALALSSITVAGGTYAWYSMNSIAQGTGISLTSNAPTNMLIATDPTSDSNFKNGIETVTSVTGGYCPASTTNGKTFYAIARTDGIDVAGSIVDNSNKDTVQFAVVGRKEDNNVYYAEVPLYIKATQDTEKAADLQMKLTNFTVSTTTHNLQKCTRVSITEVKPNTGNVCEANTGKVTVQDNGTLKDASSNTLTESDAVIYKNDSEEIKPISGITAASLAEFGTDAAITAGTATKCFSVDKDGVYYTTIIVRIWLEGQHSACVNNVTGETVSVSLDWEVMA